MYVTSKISGGLGNQLFQIFTVLNYSIKYNKTAIFRNIKELPCPGSTTRYTYWDSFLINLSHLLTNNIPNSLIYKERNHNYTPIPHHDQNIELEGFFQCYKYFEENIDKIYEMVQLENIKNTIKNKYIHYFNSSNYKISMHFRLGDYKRLQDYHPIQPYAYYETAIKEILNLLQSNIYIDILYFCEKEDNDIVKNTIIKLQEVFPTINFIKIDDDIVDWEQMIIMSLCNSNIIANSSFSWWGAYLNNNKGKLITYPSLWFGKLLTKNVSNMFPLEWIKI
jgi:hypothetical protein